MNDWHTFYRVARPFRVGSRSFRKGEIVRVDDPIVEALSDRPDLLALTATRTGPDSRRPTIEVAGVRAYVQRDQRDDVQDVQRPKPKRDWLAEPPPWRLP